MPLPKKLMMLLKSYRFVFTYLEYITDWGSSDADGIPSVSGCGVFSISSLTDGFRMNMDTSDTAIMQDLSLKGLYPKGKGSIAIQMKIPDASSGNYRFAVFGIKKDGKFVDVGLDTRLNEVGHRTNGRCTTNSLLSKTNGITNTRVWFVLYFDGVELKEYIYSSPTGVDEEPPFTYDDLKNGGVGALYVRNHGSYTSLDISSVHVGIVSPLGAVSTYLDVYKMVEWEE